MYHLKRFFVVFIATVILSITQWSEVSAETVSFINRDLNIRPFRVRNTEINFKYEKVDIEALLFKPEGKGPFPAVILLHTCGGIKNALHVTRDWPKYLTNSGYVVLTINSFDSHGMRCTKMGIQEGITKFLNQLQDAYGGLDYLNGLDFVDGDRVAPMGFSMGAMTINRYIMYENHRQVGKPKFKAAISVYGDCVRMKIRGYPRNAMPLLQIIAEHDDRTKPSCLAVAKTSAPMEVLILKGAYHGFDLSHMRQRKWDPYGNAMQYSSDATKEAQNATKAFLAVHLGK